MKSRLCRNIHTGNPAATRTYPARHHFQTVGVNTTGHRNPMLMLTAQMASASNEHFQTATCRRMYSHPTSGARMVITITLVEAIPPITTWGTPARSITRNQVCSGVNPMRSNGNILTNAWADKLRNVAHTSANVSTRNNTSATNGPRPSSCRATVATEQPPARTAMKVAR